MSRSAVTSQSSHSRQSAVPGSCTASTVATLPAVKRTVATVNKQASDDKADAMRQLRLRGEDLSLQGSSKQLLLVDHYTLGGHDRHLRGNLSGSPYRRVEARSMDRCNGNDAKYLEAMRRERGSSIDATYLRGMWALRKQCSQIGGNIY